MITLSEGTTQSIESDAGHELVAQYSGDGEMRALAGNEIESTLAYAKSLTIVEEVEGSKVAPSTGLRRRMSWPSLGGHEREPDVSATSIRNRTDDAIPQRHGDNAFGRFMRDAAEATVPPLQCPEVPSAERRVFPPCSCDNTRQRLLNALENAGDHTDQHDKDSIIKETMVLQPPSKAGH